MKRGKMIKSEYVKVVRVLNDGRRVSSFINGHDTFFNADMITYNLVDITEAPKNSLGIFLYVNDPKVYRVPGNIYNIKYCDNTYIEVYQISIFGEINHREREGAFVCPKIKLEKIIETARVNWSRWRVIGEEVLCD